MRHGGHAVGVLRNSDSCTALALPSYVEDHPADWSGKRVQVTGMAHVQPYLAELSWFQIRDRRVSANVCGSSVVIYVDAIQKLN